VFIPHIDLKPSTEDTPFGFKWRQFSIKLAFALTIRKSHGQILNYVGLCLPKSVFCHGRLYVAISRVTPPSDLRFLIVNHNNMSNNITKNIVYKVACSFALVGDSSEGQIQDFWRSLQWHSHSTLVNQF